MVIKTHITKPFELVDIPRGIIGIFAGAVIIVVVGGAYLNRFLKWVTL